MDVGRSMNPAYKVIQEKAYEMISLAFSELYYAYVNEEYDFI